VVRCRLQSRLRCYTRWSQKTNPRIPKIIDPVAENITMKSTRNFHMYMRKGIRGLMRAMYITDDNADRLGKTKPAKTNLSQCSVGRKVVV
jgi:hypothetical protein